MSGSKASAARARNGRGRGNAGAAPAPAARQAAPSPAREVASPAREIASPAADAGPREGEYVVTLPTFEGPLDLLLHLIQQHELDILDIPVSFVTEKYLEYLKLMRSLSIDLASEYLVMAATLTHIKSKMLLPSVPAGQDDDGMPGEEEDPRAELVRRLLEYQKYKVAAADLAERGTLGRDVFTRGMSESEVPKGPAPFAQTAIFSLLDAFERVLKRTNVQIDHEVVFDRISITDRIVELTEKLSARRAMRFEDLLLDSVSKGGVIPRFEVVITFLAVLEMCKLRLIRVHQTDPLAPIHIQLAVADGAPVVFDGSEDGVPMAFDGSEDGAPAAERIETAGSEEAGAPPAAAEGEMAEAVEVGRSEPAGPELVEPAEPTSGAPSGAEPAGAPSVAPDGLEPVEPVEQVEDVSAEAAEPEPAEAAEESSSEPAWSELAEPVEERNVEAGDAELAQAVEPTSGEPAWSELAEPAEESSGEASATDLPGAAEETSRADDVPAGEPAVEAVEGDADPAPGEAERDAAVDPNAHPAAEDFAAPPAEVDEVDAGSGRDGG
ncbi:segregation/condensation protein A [Sorangium sp. So ce381]|uniref:segregation and condensation protein A n=1 Tax=Sorangium sp. So ce381 TaxID=3133307 RepID=UPI003F5AFED3